MKTNRFIVILMITIMLMAILCSCGGEQGSNASHGEQDNQIDKNDTGTQDEDDKDASIDEMNGIYGLYRIVKENISSGEKDVYNVGDNYYGMLLSTNTISVTLNNGTGVMSYAFESSVTTNITYEVIDDKFIMICEDAVDLFNDGNPQYRYELLIEEHDGKICFVLNASNKYSNFSYYVIKQ